MKGKQGVVASVERKEQNESRAAALRSDLATARRQRSLRLLRAPTLRAAQSLYEGKKAITYPRTSSRYLPGDMVPQLKPVAESLRRSPTTPTPPRTSCASTSFRWPGWSTTRRSAITTPSSRPWMSTPSGFTPDERRIFDLIARRFLAVFHPPARYHARLSSPRSKASVPHPRQDHPRGRLARRLRGWRPTARGRPGRGRRGGGRAAAARARPAGHVRRGRERRARDEAAPALH